MAFFELKFGLYQRGYKRILVYFKSKQIATRAAKTIKLMVERENLPISMFEIYHIDRSGYDLKPSLFKINFETCKHSPILDQDFKDEIRRYVIGELMREIES